MASSTAAIVVGRSNFSRMALMWSRVVWMVIASVRLTSAGLRPDASSDRARGAPSPAVERLPAGSPLQEQAVDELGEGGLPGDDDHAAVVDGGVDRAVVGHDDDGRRPVLPGAVDQQAMPTEPQRAGGHDDGIGTGDRRPVGRRAVDGTQAGHRVDGRNERVTGEPVRVVHHDEAGRREGGDHDPDSRVDGTRAADDCRVMECPSHVLCVRNWLSDRGSVSREGAPAPLQCS
jgi:hypothetical protein